MAEDGMDDGDNDNSNSNSCSKSSSDEKFERAVEEVGKKGDFQDDESPKENMHGNI
ncbi:hypothetical protein CCACVL1_04312 [Corchorus capsularis]|uniref:Uncharacterized protein n=1 Tax=Corchorus capsularis TaxID=210143 RepID=A0A1R3JTG8_COCAP|nr:hypothetical protein CCACVL1_04312 [Corchorus capsularis]